MDRLTFLDNGSPAFICGDWTKAARKLYAYEGTGLTPEEIIAMKADCERRHKLYEDVMSVLEKQSESRGYDPCPDCGGGPVITEKFHRSRF